MKNYQILRQMLSCISSILEKETPNINLYATTQTFVMGDVVVEIKVKTIDQLPMPN